MTTVPAAVGEARDGLHAGWSGREDAGSGKTSTGSAAQSAHLSPALLLVLPAVALGGTGFAEAVPGGVSTADTMRLVLTLAWSMAAAFLLVRPGLRRLGGLVALATLLGAASFAMSVIGRTTGGEDGRLARFAATVIPALAMAATAHILVALPDGRLGSRARRTAIAAGYVAGAAFGLWAWVGPGRMSPAAAALGWLVAVVLGSIAAAHRYPRVPGVARQRLQVLAAGAVASVEVGMAVGALAVLIEWPAEPWPVIAGATAIVPVAVAVSSLPRLLGSTDKLLVQLLTVTAMSALMIGIYLLVVLGFGHSPGPSDHQLLGLSILAAAFVSVGAFVFHRRVQRLAQHLVYGSDPVPDDVVRTFGSRLTRAVTMDELLMQFIESLHKSMTLTSAEVYTGVDEILERTASIPDRGPGTIHVGPKEQPVVARAGVSGNAWASVWLPAVVVGRSHTQLRVCPITYGGDLLGLVAIERATTELPFTEKEDLTLIELTRQVGLALHNVRLDSALQSTLDEVRRQAAELRASRSRIVAAADAERRRVERDLHDGAQQHLVALAVNLRLARDLVAEDPSAAAEALDEIASEVKATVQELRDLAHGIYPPLLVDNGLPDALRAVASRSPLDVEVSIGELPRFDAAIEAAVYFCCLEALQNAAKHAPSSHVDVGIWQEEGGLLFAVTDDGPGIDPEVAGGGHGFVNMSDRLGAIGGSIRWETALPHGTSVRGSIPLA